MSENDELKARIAALAGRLNREKQRQAGVQPVPHSTFTQPSHSRVIHPYQRARGSFYSRGPSRRGGPVYRNRTLIFHQPNSLGQRSEGNIDDLTSSGEHAHSQATSSKSGASTSPPQPEWYSKTGRHIQLINASVMGKKTTASPEPVGEGSAGANFPQQTSFSRPIPATASSPVEIEGIIFRPEYNGNRLVRLSLSAKPSPKVATYNGVTYVRSKNGNLYRSSYVLQPATTNANSGKLCPQFTNTGVCTRGSRCRHIHDATKVAICKDFLNNRDCRAGSMCDLSHEVSAHRSPVCVHYLRGNCLKDLCRYSHVNVAPDAPICRDFATLGYCEKGPNCMDRHVCECPDYANDGVCVARNCRLPHIDRAGMLRKVAGIQQPQAPAMSAPNSSSCTNDEVAESDEGGSDNLDTASIDSDDDVIRLDNPNPKGLSQQEDFIPF